ncbi:hypothetical protein SCLARK_007 [Spiroplasma clarkii]|nr:hypothetical protein SCLARK_007 [Spiroplasma clarkii]
MKNSNELISDQCYSVTAKEANHEINYWEKEGWKEAPVDIHSFESFIAKKDQFAIYNNGLNEFQRLDDSTVAITLYRSVSYLGRNNLLWRPGRASGTSEFSIKTPQAKLISTKFKFKFRIDLRKDINPAQNAKEFITSPLYYQKQNYNNLFKSFDRFLSKGDKIIYPNKKF